MLLHPEHNESGSAVTKLIFVVSDCKQCPVGVCAAHADAAECSQHLLAYKQALADTLA